MTHHYHITGMTCSGCQAKVQSLLSKINHVTRVAIDLAKEEATVDMDRHIPTSELQEALKDYPKYQLTEAETPMQREPSPNVDVSTSWLTTYKPILLIFAYITGITILVEAYDGHFQWMHWMNYFMAGFFLTFSFFKLLNLKGFAESYSTYDIVAKRWLPWGYIYVFIELALGVAYLLHWNPLVTNGITFAVMSISIVGVLQSVLNKRKIRCACLGDVFNLPMSTITVIEDALMIAMSGITLLILL